MPPSPYRPRTVACPAVRWRSLAALAAAALAAVAAGCGESEPPRRATASKALSEAPRGEAAPTGATARSLGDSALEPAADEAMKAEDWKRAEELYRELGRRQPNNAAGPHGLGMALMRQDRNDEAAAALTEGLKLKDDARTRIDLAAAYAAAGRYPSALPHLRKAVQLAPREPAAWAGLAEALVRVDKPDGAADTLKEAARACPACARDGAVVKVTDELARAYAARADKAAVAGDVAGARKALDAALALRPDLPEGHLAAARLARAKKDGKTAAEEYRRAIEALGSSDAEGAATARVELAALLVERGDADEAVTLARQVVAANAEHAGGLDALGRACEATRDRECAKKAYAQLLRLPAGPAVPTEVREHAQQRMKDLKGGKAPKRRRHR